MPSVYTVNTTADDPNGRIAGQETLRDAINDANANPGSRIVFNIPTTDPGFKVNPSTGEGNWIIQPTTALPTITGAGTFIDGIPSGLRPLEPLIIVDGSRASALSGLDVEASNVWIKGLFIDNWSLAGIRVGNTAAVFNTLIAGNKVEGNGYGIFVEQHAGGTVIGGPTPDLGYTYDGTGNVIYRNKSEGIIIQGADGTTVQGNSIREDGVEGILLTGPTNTTIGGTHANEGNEIISNGTGIQVVGATVSTLVPGNHISANTLNGIALGFAGGSPASGVTVGGSQPGAGNLIESNHGNGVEIVGSQNAIVGNTIFTNRNGVQIDSGSQDAIWINSIGENNNLGIMLNNGANNNAVAPILTSAYYLDSKGNVTVSGTLNGAANTFYLVQLFNSLRGDPQGEKFAQSIYVGTDSNGHASFTTLLTIKPDDLITATATDPRNNTSAFSNAVVAKPEVYVLGEDHKLWLESPDWRQNGRTLIDTNVEAFAPTDNGQVYVEGIDHKLWLEGADWQQNGRTLIDLNVQAIAAADYGKVYVIGRDTKLWLEGPDWQQNGRAFIDLYVQAVAPVLNSQNTQIYVVGMDNKLWLEGAGWQQNGRTFIDLYVQAVAPTGNDQVYVQGIDHKLWLEGPDWQKKGRSFIDLNVEAFAPADNGKVYVEGTDHKLWLEGADWQKNGRTFVDLYVEAVKPVLGSDNSQVYVVGTDTKLWLEGPDWQKNGRTFVDLYVESI